MKHTLLTLSGILFLSLNLTAQNFSQQSIENSLQLYQQLKEKAIQLIEKDNLKANRNQKSIILSESYYSLEYNDTTQSWDTTYRVSWYGDTINNQLVQTAIAETYTPQGFYKSDSAIIYLDTTFKYYKVNGKTIVPDSSQIFLLDTTSNTWISFVKEFNLPNANGDLDISYTNFGPLFTDSAKYSYDASNNLTYFVRWSSNFFTQVFEKLDSVVCQSNINGYRTLDSIYNLDSSMQWQFNYETFYDYDSRNNLIRESDIFYRYAYSYNANDELIADSLYSSFGPNPGFALQAYTLYDTDSTTEYFLNGSIPEIQSVDRYYFTNNRTDSALYIRRLISGSSSQLRLSAKDIYIYNITDIYEQSQAELSFQSYPNPALNELYVECPEGRFEVLLYDLNGMERFRSMERGNFKIDVSNFSRGMYFLRINDSVKKIIIQ